MMGGVALHSSAVVDFELTETSSFFEVKDLFIKCYYDEKCCSRSLSILILYLAKMHHANY